MVILKIEIQDIFLIIQLFIYLFFSIGKQLCLFSVVYFGWAEPSWPRGFSLAAVSRADSRLRCVASPCGGSPAAGRGLPGTVLAARGLRSCAA